MNIGILGSGMIGVTAARLFAAVEHKVVLSNRHGLDTLADMVAAMGRTSTPLKTRPCSGRSS